MAFNIQFAKSIAFQAIFGAAAQILETLYDVYGKYAGGQ